jgi:hypothetical protein
MDFEYEKYKCRVLLRLVGTVEGFHWFRFTEFIPYQLLYKCDLDSASILLPAISIVMTPTIVLCECIVQRRYLFFVKLCFDNIMSIIMKVSYMKSNNKG